MVSRCCGAVNDVGDDAPNHEMALCADAQVGVALVGGHEVEPVVTQGDALDGELTVDEAHGDVAVVRVKGLVDDDEVAVANSRVNHRVAAHARTKGGGGAVDERAVQVDGVAKGALGGAGEARLNVVLGELDGIFAGTFYWFDVEIVHNSCDKIS